MKLVFFEDYSYRKLYPVTHSLPLALVPVGPLRLYEVWASKLGISDCAVYTRGPVARYWAWRLRVLEGKNVEVNPGSLDDEVLAVNQALLPTEDAVSAARLAAQSTGNVVVHKGGRPLIVKVSRAYADFAAEAFSKPLEPELLYNLLESVRDVPIPSAREVTGVSSLLEAVLALLPESLAGRRAGQVGEGVVIDESRAPVIVEDGARVEPPCRLAGPAYIGRGVTVGAGSVIEASVVVGPARVEHSVVKRSIVEWCSTIEMSWVERTVCAGAAWLAPFSSSWGSGARAMGYFSRLMPSSQLRGSSSAGHGSTVDGAYSGELPPLTVFSRGAVDRISARDVVRAFRSYVAEVFNRLPSDYEVELLSLS